MAQFGVISNGLQIRHYLSVRSDMYQPSNSSHPGSSLPANIINRLMCHAHGVLRSKERSWSDRSVDRSAALAVNIDVLARPCSTAISVRLDPPNLHILPRYRWNKQVVTELSSRQRLLLKCFTTSIPFCGLPCSPQGGFCQLNRPKGAPFVFSCIVSRHFERHFGAFWEIF